jgi:hypothetical protein
VDGLEAQQSESGSPVDWEQAAKDNDALDNEVKKRREVAFKDRKAEYDKLLVEHK